MAELTAELAELEAAAPAIAEAVCSGAAGIRDFPALARACQAAEAIASWGCTYPELTAEWQKLGWHALTVLRSLSALDTSGSWSPPVPDDEHPG